MPSKTVQCFIGLGSNIDPEKNLREAARHIRELFPCVRFSSVYQSKAQEYEDQPDFLNAVAEIETEKSPEDLKKTLEDIEQQLRKAVPFRFGPRTIDLDLLLYGERVLSTPTLFIPHPRMHERRFVLEPLFELDPAGKHPLFQKAWKTFLEKMRHQECQKTGIIL